MDYSVSADSRRKVVAVVPVETHEDRTTDPGRPERGSWREEMSVYRARVRPWAEDRLRRAARREKHPVYDFLFEYYSFRPAHLLRWTPGFGVALPGATRDDIVWSEFVECDGGRILPACAFPTHRLSYLRWAVEYLAAVQDREPAFACMGLHEWAMVYRDPNVRHPYVPLRLSRGEIDSFVESQALLCTHYDAFRFFTHEAAPRNRWELTRATTAEHDQPGCIHANMDLYRFAYKIAPFCASELVAGAFEVARTAREVDMRASPYDLSSYGFTPIPIETRTGREEYVELQRDVASRARPVRAQVLEVYQRLLQARIGE